MMTKLSVGVALLIGFGCSKAGKNDVFKIQEERRQEEIRAKVAPFAARYHAVVDWSKGLENRNMERDVWTIMVQDALMMSRDTPVVIVGELQDVARDGDQYYLTVGLDATWAEGKHINLRAVCSESVARLAVEMVDRTNFIEPNVVLIVKVRSVSQPRFKTAKISRKGTSDESAKTVIVDGDLLSIEGECLDWILLDSGK
jgi:hypothetical protein